MYVRIKALDKIITTSIHTLFTSKDLGTTDKFASFLGGLNEGTRFILNYGDSKSREAICNFVPI